MSQFIELQRSRLEEIDALRDATFKRFRKNPELIPKEIRQKDDILSGKKPRPHKQTMLQSQELGFFQKKYNSNAQILQTLSKDIIKESLEKVTDNEVNFKHFDSLYEDLKNMNSDPTIHERDIKSLYAMYSSTPTREVQTTKKGKIKSKRKYILSEQAAIGLGMDTMFSEEEHLGKFVDLRDFHATYKKLKQEDISYSQFLRSFQKVPYSGIKDVQEYNAFVKDLAQYLIHFIERSQPTVDIQKVKDDIGAAFMADKKEDNQTQEGQVYCKACDKLFTKETVYKGHLAGKKHKNNLKKLDTEIPEDKYNEFQVKFLADYLKTKIQDTIVDVERKEGMTERERWLEKTNLEEQDSEYTTVDSNSSDDEGKEGSDDEDSELFKDLPTGADGTPIPFWLYKLQGLHHSYNCEICGNITYKGRQNFEKHFSSGKHQNGLKMLGISTAKMGLFMNITTIDEAVSLWNTIKQEEASKEDADDEIEVEDDEGNVMTKKDYLQLKKQGII